MATTSTDELLVIKRLTIEQPIEHSPITLHRVHSPRSRFISIGLLLTRSRSMALINLLRVWPGPPAEQPVRDLRAAKSAILVGVLNGVSFSSPSDLHRCLCCDGGAGNAERRYDHLCQLAGFATAVLGVALLVADMAFSAATRAILYLGWMVWLTKVLTGGTLQFGLSVLHFCLRMMFARFT
ncbi:uncharacterized protein LOC120639215 [Panicum virgatum]|uniref:uncharacterized protein LOC120639215 n=1 Tax=Panicum virgatum TaxID=38727 RepID=UPI0019D5399E|nr:uncharacterized protein LOC120639215 [Panicum virgatum]